MDNSQEAEIKRRIIARCEERLGKPIFNLLPIKTEVTILPLPGAEEKKDD